MKAYMYALCVSESEQTYCNKNKAEFHILLLHSKVETHSFGNEFVEKL